MTALRFAIKLLKGWLKTSKLPSCPYQGLVCSSCAIGLRIHTSKLEGVDKSQLTKGVDLDVKKQLVLVAFKSDAAIDVDGVREAIYNAGFDPVHYYIWTEMGGITQTVYPASEK